MGETGIGSLLLFGYLSMALVIGVFVRSQLKVFQKYLIPGCVIAGLLMLIVGPNFLNIVKAPTVDEADFLVFNLLTVIFIIMGLRGFTPPDNKTTSSPAPVKFSGREGLKPTAVISSMLSLQLVIGVLFTFFIILAINPGLFRGFGSMLMLGQGFDPLIARYFGGSWEQEFGLYGGQSVAYAFSSLGFLIAYLLGLGYIIWAKKKGLIPSVYGEEDAAVQTGILEPGKDKKAAGLLTTHGQTIETFSLHLAIVGLVLLVLYGLFKLVALVMINNLSPGMVIVTEVLLNFNYLFGLLMGLAARRLLIGLKVDYVVDRRILDRILGAAVDYMVVVAIASIPLAISTVHPWETLALSLTGAGAVLLAVRILMEKVCQDRSIGRQVALFGFLTGNISTSVALLRVLDPNYEDPFIRNLAYAGGLSFIVALPLFFLMNLPVVGGLGHLAMASGLAALYGGLIFCGWYFLIYRRKTSGNKAEKGTK